MIIILIDPSREQIYRVSGRSVGEAIRNIWPSFIEKDWDLNNAEILEKYKDWDLYVEHDKNLTLKGTFNRTSGNSRVLIFD
jgi:hypothetical protein